MNVGVRIVAEAAQGFEGDPSVARLLARAAARSGADAVKFQLVYARELAIPTYPYFSLFQTLEMTDQAWHEVAEEARRGNLQLVFDVFGPDSLDLAARLGAAAVKIHVTDFFNDALVDRALAVVPEVFFSAGGMTADDIEAFLTRRDPAAVGRLTLLYGFQAEPTATADNHLARLSLIRRRFPALALGFMDHADGALDEGSWLGVLAVALGVSVIEKHITLDRSLRMEDYVSALAPVDFAQYVRRLRAAAEALGSADLALRPAEQEYRRRAVKVVVATRALTMGTVVRAADLALLRTSVEADRPTCERFEDVEGRPLATDVQQWQALSREHLR